MHWAFNSSIHKRVPSKETVNVVGRDGGAADRLINGAKLDSGNPSWKLSLPHVCVATISSFLFGYHVGVVNEPLESVSLALGFGGNTMAEGLVVSICLGGAFIGCMFSGWFADGIGRRRAFQLSALPMIVGASVSATTRSLQGMLLGRFLVGIGMGIGPPVASLYITEVSPASVRGTYGSLIQIATCLGLIGSFLIGIPVKRTLDWWRVCFWLSVIPATLLVFFMEFCAESPHWLYKRGKVAEAEDEFERLLGGGHVNFAIADLSRSDRGDDAEGARFLELIYGRHFRVIFIGATLYGLQQLSGINAIFYFSSALFKSAGVPSALANICLGFANLAGSIIAMVLMDKVGRKMLLLGSFSGMAVAMTVQAAASTFHDSVSWTLYVSVFGMLMYVLSFSLGAGPVPGLLLPEIFPNRVRASCMAFCLCVHWVVNFFVGLLFLRLLEQLGPCILYSTFASVCLLATFFVKKNVVETKGKSLQEIEVSLLASE